MEVCSPQMLLFMNESYKWVWHCGSFSLQNVLWTNFQIQNIMMMPWWKVNTKYLLPVVQQYSSNNMWLEQLFGVFQLPIKLYIQRTKCHFETNLSHNLIYIVGHTLS